MTVCVEQHSNMQDDEAQRRQHNQQLPQQQAQKVPATMQWLSTSGDGVGLEAGGQRMVLDLDDVVAAGEQ